MSETDAHANAPVRPDQSGTDGQTDSSPRPPGRKFVLFADGTGNAFTTQESNIWRLYEALDHTRTDQVAYYIKGVGTAGWRPFAALDGATGIGVPSNVRKLYRFLCWNWQPGDEIYIFGFSRGAFTARTLVAMIASQGLVPAMIDGTPVSHDEMQRNAMAAWRAYRRQTVPWRSSLPTIWIARAIRDIVLAAYHAILRHRPYSKVRASMMPERQEVGISFLGLFDTVEAFGVPVEELRTAIDWAIWPISFRNHVLSRKVKCARHALSLDDERTTFHPIRIDHPDGSERIKEVWFAGAHSDVGGGYPDGTLSFVPLVWMVGQLGGRLRFQPGSIAHFETYQSAIGPSHDSRKGAAVLYRYGPRHIGANRSRDGGPPVVHMSVVGRMLHGCDNYAPVTLPASARVLLPNGAVMSLTKPETRGAMRSAYAAAAPADGAHANAVAESFTRMSPPDEKLVGQTLDTVWWRRFAYFALLATIALLAAWPWAAETVIGWFKGPTAKIHLLSLITALDYRITAVIGSAVTFLQGFLPSYSEPWLRITLYYPFATTLVVALALAAWRLNGFLRDRILDRARLAWDRPGRKVRKLGKPSWLLKIARVMRLYGGPINMAFSKFLVPGVFLMAIFGVAALAAGRSYFNWRLGTGDLCRSTDAISVDEQPTPPALFPISDFCWASGLQVEKGRKYRIWVTVKDPWFDGTVMSGVNGFQSYRGAYLAKLPIRRSYAAAWLQPIVRIGAQGSSGLPLQAVNGIPPDDLPRPGGPGDGSRQRELADALVAEFVAPDTGELFLYVNDAVQLFPLFGKFERFYDNNSGTAEVRVQRIPAPLVSDGR